MPEQRTDPVWLDDVESPPKDLWPRRLCIVTGDALPSREFIAALQTAVGPNEEIEIILDRRRGGPGIAPGQPPVDRRRLPHVDRMARMDGYAIVPVPTSPSRPPRVPDPPIAPRPTERQRHPTERRAAEPRRAERPAFEGRPFEDDTDADERELERILQFKRRHGARLGPMLLLTALVGVLVVLLLIQLPAVKTLVSRTRPAAPPPAERTSATLQAAHAPSAAETPSPPRQRGASPPPRGAESPETARLPGANSTARPQTDTVASIPPAPPSRVSSSPSEGIRAPDTLRGESSRFPGVPRVELVRNSLPTADGKADSYVVRLSDPAGRPLAGAEVLLLASMADGTVENIMLGAGPEPGTYAGTSRPSRSVPVDLRVRMTMSDKRIEIPLRP